MRAFFFGIMRNLKEVYSFLNNQYALAASVLSPVVDLPFSRINVLLTRKCNERCSFCRVYEDLGKEREDALSYEEWKKVLLSIPKFTTISFSGGEPTTIPYLFDLIKDLHSAGKRCAIVTNATYFTPEDTEKICKSNLMYMMISIHGTEKTHDEVTNLKGGFQKIIKNIKSISDYKKKYGLKYPIIGIKSIITEENADELVELCDQLEKLDVTDLYFNILNDSVLQHRLEVVKDITSATEDYRYHKYDSEKISAIKESLKLINSKKYRFKIGYSNSFKETNDLLSYFGNEGSYKISKCNMPFTDLTLHENGTISPCHSIDLGNVRDINYDFNKIKKLEKYKEYIKEISRQFPNPKICQGCNHAPLLKT